MAVRFDFVPAMSRHELSSGTHYLRYLQDLQGKKIWQKQCLKAPVGGESHNSFRKCRPATTNFGQGPALSETISSSSEFNSATFQATSK